MLIWTIRRLFAAFWTALAAFVIVFSLLRMVPGDPIDLMLGEQALPSQKEQLRQHLNLDEPWHRQIASDLIGLSHGNLGISVTTQKPVSTLIAERTGPTAALAFASLAIAILIALPLGMAAGWHPNSRIDNFSRVISVAGVSIPNFWLGPLLLLVFAVNLRLLPLGGYRDFQSLLLPAITLGSALAAMLARMLRSSLADTREMLYIRTARAKGLDESGVLWRHALRPSILPVLTIVGLQLGALLSGAVITETIFQWPGIGRLLIESVQSRDYPVVQGVVVVLTLTYVLVNTLVDLAYGWIDPRIRIASA